MLKYRRVFDRFFHEEQESGMMEQVIIRNETEGDYREVEELTRRAFLEFVYSGMP